MFGPFGPYVVHLQSRISLGIILTQPIRPFKQPTPTQKAELTITKTEQKKKKKSNAMTTISYTTYHMMNCE